MNKHIQMLLGHQSGSFTLAYVVFSQSSTWRTPGKSEPDCSQAWAALRAWQWQGLAGQGCSQHWQTQTSLSGMEVAAASVDCCPNCTVHGRVRLALLAGYPGWCWAHPALPPGTQNIRALWAWHLWGQSINIQGNGWLLKSSISIAVTLFLSSSSKVKTQPVFPQPFLSKNGACVKQSQCSCWPGENSLHSCKLIFIMTIVQTQKICLEVSVCGHVYVCNVILVGLNIACSV